MTAPITAVVVHWNQSDACSTTIHHLKRESLIGSIVVVDNGSRPAELDRIRSIPSIRLIELDSNRGFGPGTNEGWRRWLEDEQTDWCLALPHDAEPAPGAIRRLLEFGESDATVGLVSADVGDGMLPFVDPNFGPIFRPQSQGSGFQRCDYPHGTMFLARRRCLEDIGLYDERFFTYCEEADLGLRATAAGWKVGMAVGARVFNPRVSTPRPVAGYLMERNTLLLVGKHFGALPTVVRSVIAIGQFVRGVVQPSRRTEYWSTRGRAMALRDAALRRWGPPPDLA